MFNALRPISRLYPNLTNCHKTLLATSVRLNHHKVKDMAKALVIIADGSEEMEAVCCTRFEINS